MSHAQSRTLTKASMASSLSYSPAGLGSGLPAKSGPLVPGQGLRPSAGHRRGLRSTSATAALPVPFIELSLFLEPLDNVRSSVSEEFVLQSTLQVHERPDGLPAARALATSQQIIKHYFFCASGPSTPSAPMSN